jgi:Methylase involved in ubiquinone/menaquinone biosynthesis
MYTKINILPSLQEEAIQFVMDNDRLLYRPFFEAAERFCAANNVLLGGRVGIDLLIGRPLRPDSFFWELYCEDTFNKAKALAHELAEVHSPHIPARTVALQTNIRHREFTIFVEARILFKIYALRPHKDISLIDLMGPVTRGGYFTGVSIKCIPEEIQLMDIYRNLYTPAKNALWEQELESEQKLYETIRGVLVDKVAQKIRGASEPKLFDPTPELLKLAAEHGWVVVGDFALSKLGFTQSPKRLQLICSEIPSEIARIVGRRCKGTAVQTVQHNLNIPSDFQITKHTLYISNGQVRVPAADIYNCTAFEMIPFVEVELDTKMPTAVRTAKAKAPKLRIGNPWVLLRFLFMDIWVLKLILNSDVRGQAFIHGRIRELVSMSEKVRDAAYKDLPATFQLNNYGGQYISETVAKKRIIKERGERFPMYYPAAQAAPAATAAAVSQDHTGSDETNLDDILNDKLTSRPVDLAVDTAGKIEIMKKFMKFHPGRVKGPDDLRALLEEYRSMNRDYSKWGVGKSTKSFLRKNQDFLKYIQTPPEVIVDVGCGSGDDVAALGKATGARRIICVDISDTRSNRDSEFVLEEQERPIDLPDEIADVVVLFHVVHHITNEPLEFRLRDIVRLMKPGGILLFKDHDIKTPTQASNVDFEHVVYMLNGWEGTVDDLLLNFPQYEPMIYRSAAEVHRLLTELGLERIWTGVINPRNYNYGAVYSRPQ